MILKNFRRQAFATLFCSKVDEKFRRSKDLFKRKLKNHTGAHKINNTVWTSSSAKKMGRKIIAETGAGQHGVATAAVAARHGLECIIFMSEESIEKTISQYILRMKLLGATVCAVDSGTKTLKDAMNEAMRDWVTNVDDTHYIIGSVAGLIHILK